MITKAIALDRFMREGYIPVKNVEEYSSPEILEIAIELEKIGQKQRQLLARLKNVIETDDII